MAADKILTATIVIVTIILLNISGVLGGYSFGALCPQCTHSQQCVGCKGTTGSPPPGASIGIYRETNRKGETLKILDRFWCDECTKAVDTTNCAVIKYHANCGA